VLQRPVGGQIALGVKREAVGYFTQCREKKGGEWGPGACVAKRRQRGSQPAAGGACMRLVGGANGTEAAVAGHVGDDAEQGIK
jgi:hypothetical protein